MLMLIAGLISLVVFSFASLLLLNYSIYLWENQRIDDLANQAKVDNNDILARNSATYGFSTHDMSQVAMNSRKDIVLAKNGNFFSNFFSNFSHSQANFIDYLKHSWNYIISVTAPPKPQLSNHDDPKIIEQKQDVDKTISKFAQTNPELNNKISKTKPLSWVKDYNSEEEVSNNQPEITEQTSQSDFSSVNETTQTFSNTSNTKGATINLVTSDDEDSKNQDQQTKKDKALYQKLEARILENLRSTGLNNYSVWMQLGKLYEKYEEREKAVEIYALVLKHSDGKEKELARNKLIALT